jgi:hypothetical protein
MRLIFIILAHIIYSGCSYNEKYRLYQLSDMDVLLQDYYVNDLKRISPGLACDIFKGKGNGLGCFKLLVDSRHGKVVKLVHQEMWGGGATDLIYEFDPPVNYVYIEKLNQQNIQGHDPDEEVTLKKDQPSLELVFFEKSSVAFYWETHTFRSIWTSD